MAYTTINKSSSFMNPKLYTGNGGTNAQTGVGFQPDWIWFKRRDGSDNHILFDVARGVTKGIYSDLSNAEDTLANSLSSFNSDGFTLGADTGSGGAINGSGESCVAWNWKAGGAGSNNTEGSIYSTVSVNQTAGFSIVKWTGTNANATVGHGLSSEPTFVFYKVLGEAGSWAVYNKDLGANKYLSLDATTLEATDTGMFQNTNPTGGKLYVGANLANKSSPMIAYCFTPKTGYSKFGSYTGNGNNDGPFVYTGFKPSFIIGKRTDAAGPWWMLDNKRNPFNVVNRYLLANDNAAEATDVEYNTDILSNGFKARYNNANFNASGGTYIYMAFGQTLVGTNNVPNNAF